MKALTQRLLRVRLVRIGSGLNGGTLIYLEDLGRAQSEAQQMKLAAMGRRLRRSDGDPAP